MGEGKNMSGAKYQGSKGGSHKGKRASDRHRRHRRHDEVSFGLNKRPTDSSRILALTRAQKERQYARLLAGVKNYAKRRQGLGGTEDVKGEFTPKDIINTLIMFNDHMRLSIDIERKLKYINLYQDYITMTQDFVAHNSIPILRDDIRQIQTHIARMERVIQRTKGEAYNINIDKLLTSLEASSNSVIKDIQELEEIADTNHYRELTGKDYEDVDSASYAKSIGSGLSHSAAVQSAKAEARRSTTIVDPKDARDIWYARERSEMLRAFHPDEPITPLVIDTDAQLKDYAIKKYLTLKTLFSQLLDNKIEQKIRSATTSTRELERILATLEQSRMAARITGGVVRKYHDTRNRHPNEILKQIDALIAETRVIISSRQTDEQEFNAHLPSGVNLSAIVGSSDIRDMPGRGIVDDNHIGRGMHAMEDVEAEPYEETPDSYLSRISELDDTVEHEDVHAYIESANAELEGIMEEIFSQIEEDPDEEEGEGEHRGDRPGMH